MAQHSSLSDLGNLVRNQDRDRFRTALFLPAELREAAFAIYAFNHEISKTREVVSDPILGQIRLQWWREAVDEIFAGAPRRHEVVTPLAAAVDRYGLSRAPFDTMIDAREEDLTDTAPPRLADLESYALRTGAPPIILTLELLGSQGDPAVTAAEALGTAYAMAGLLRAIPFHGSAAPGDLADRDR